jgi:GxxExxY protein
MGNKVFREDDRMLPLKEVTGRIIGSAFTVSNGLGCGFLEKVYEKTLAHEIRKTGLKCVC